MSPIGSPTWTWYVPCFPVMEPLSTLGAVAPATAVGPESRVGEGRLVGSRNPDCSTMVVTPPWSSGVTTAPAGDDAGTGAGGGAGAALATPPPATPTRTDPRVTPAARSTPSLFRMGRP